MKRPQYVFRPNLNDPQHRRAWALLQQVPPAKRKEFLVQSIKQPEISRIEGVHSSKVSVAIRRGLRNMRRCYDGLFQTE